MTDPNGVKATVETPPHFPKHQMRPLTTPFLVITNGVVTNASNIAADALGLDRHQLIGTPQQLLGLNQPPTPGRGAIHLEGARGCIRTYMTELEDGSLMFEFDPPAPSDVEPALAHLVLDHDAVVLGAEGTIRELGLHPDDLVGLRIDQVFPTASPPLWPLPATTRVECFVGGEARAFSVTVSKTASGRWEMGIHRIGRSPIGRGEFESFLSHVPSPLALLAPRRRGGRLVNFDIVWFNEAARQILKNPNRRLSLSAFPHVGDDALRMAIKAWEGNDPVTGVLDQREYRDPRLVVGVFKIVMYRTGDHVAVVFENQHSQVESVETTARVLDVLVSQGRQLLDAVDTGVTVLRPTVESDQITQLTVTYRNASAEAAAAANLTPSREEYRHVADDIQMLELFDLASTAWNTFQTVDVPSTLSQLFGVGAVHATLKRVNNTLALLTANTDDATTGTSPMKVVDSPPDQQAGRLEVERLVGFLRGLLENLQHAAFILEPIRSHTGRVVDLRVEEDLTVPHSPTYRINPVITGSLASETFHEPQLAFDAVERLLQHGSAPPYEIEFVTEYGTQSYVVHSFAVGARVAQVLVPAPSREHNDGQLTALLAGLADPTCLAHPVIDSGVVVDAIIVASNAEVWSRTLDESPKLRLPDSPVNWSPAQRDLFQAAWEHPGTRQRLTGNHGQHDDRYWFVLFVTRVADVFVCELQDHTKVESTNHELLRVRDFSAAMLEAMPFAASVVKPVFDGPDIVDAHVVVLNAAERARASVGAPGVLVSHMYPDFDAVGLPLLRESWNQPEVTLSRTVDVERDGFRTLLTLTARRIGDAVFGVVQDHSRVEQSRLRALASEGMFRDFLERVGLPVVELVRTSDGCEVVYVNDEASTTGLDWLEGDLVGLYDSGTPQRREVRVGDRIFEASIERFGDRLIAWLGHGKRLGVSTVEWSQEVLTEVITGLPNSKALKATLDVELAAHGVNLALVMFDCVGFDEVQRSLGLSLTEEFLATAGRALRREITLFTDCTVVVLAHNFGGTFSLLARDLKNPDGFLSQLHQVCTQLSGSSPMVTEVPVYLEMVAGVAFSPLHGREAEQLTIAAKEAAWQARQQRKPVRIWEPETRTAHISHRELLVRLEHALEHAELHLEYHPKIDMGSGRVAGFEAQVRWRPADGSPASAGFVELLNNSVLSVRYGCWLIDQTAQAAAAFDSDLVVSCDIPSTLLRDQDLPRIVRNALVRAGIEARRLCLEVGSSDTTAGTAEARAILSELAQMGVQLALDDFGSGAINLAQLRRLPVQEIKVDRTFTRRLGEDPVGSAVVKSCVDIARSLCMRVTVEGVEKASEAAAARTLGCDLAQGFFFSRPLPLDRALEELRAGQLSWEPGRGRG